MISSLQDCLSASSIVPPRALPCQHLCPHRLLRVDQGGSLASILHRSDNSRTYFVSKLCIRGNHKAFTFTHVWSDSQMFVPRSALHPLVADKPALEAEQLRIYSSYSLCCPQEFVAQLTMDMVIRRGFRECHSIQQPRHKRRRT